MIEPHAPLLDFPTDDQLLYKVMRVEHFLQSLSQSYIYFSRVDDYKDFKDADPADSKQLPQDMPINSSAKFTDSNYSAGNYYDKCRSETYACCFSLENSSHIWEKYGNGGKQGKICLIFNFGKLRAFLNNIYEHGHLLYENSLELKKIFDINYGLVKYVDRKTYQTNKAYLANPIQYTYIKDNEFEPDKECRISLSHLSTMTAALQNGNKIIFPPGFHFGFDFKFAKANGIIADFICSSDCNLDYLGSEFNKLGIPLTIGAES